jgi:hypothetical protein|tara:strand:- start:3398 stop:4063 length:666 start_codon:yes stop_codon:yes gene_type:complete
MGRFFITPREINFINDIAKEIVKDVIGQKIYYFPISEIKSKVHDVYEESPDKVFENPIEIDCLVKYQPQEIRTNRFGSEEYYTVEAYVQSRDLLDKGIEVLEGDFFSYGTTFFEVIKGPASDVIFGQIEHKTYITITGKQSRKGQFISKIFGPTSEEYTDSDAVQETFVQQRGAKTNKEGVTGDVRELQKNGVLDSPITGPKEVSSKGDPQNVGSAFYDED